MKTTSSDAGKAWRCLICGYIHRGDEPPELCPVCGAPQADFELYEEEVAAAAVAFDAWQCLTCAYIHEGSQPPETCPVCGAGADRFDGIQKPQNSGAPVPGVTLRIVIIGGGIAGISAAEAARRQLPEAEILLLCAEPALPYYRLNLTRCLAGDIPTDGLPIHTRDWFQQQRIELHTGCRVTHLHPAARTLNVLDQPEPITYDKLVLATGSHPYLPPLPGNELPGVTSLRTAEDVRRILETLNPATPCVCIGGGILGLETAGALAQRGANVILLESHEWLMPRQLTRSAAALLERQIRRMGIDLRKEARTRSFCGHSALEAVELQNGEQLATNLAVLATGVRPDTYLAREAGLHVDQGIVVDNHLRTSDPDIFAAGDAAEHNGVLYGAWGPSQFQGAIAGANAAGGNMLFGGVPRANTLKVLGIDVLSIGTFAPPDGSYITVEQAGETTLQHFVFHDGKLVGAILIGHPELAGATRHAIEQGQDFSAQLTQDTILPAVLERLQAE